MLLNQYKNLTRDHYRILAIAWAGWVFDFYDLILFSFLLIPIGAEFGLSQVDLSLALGASLLFTAIGGVVFGYLSDAFGRRRALQWTILIYSIGTFLTAFTASLPALILLRAVTGLGVGGEWATGQTYIGETFPAQVRAQFGSFMQTGAPVGVILAALVGGLLAPQIGWRACFAISILPALLVVAVRYHLPESDVWEQERHKKPAAPDWRILLTGEYRSLFFKALLLAVFGMSAYWFTFSWLPSYLSTEHHLSIAASAGWIIANQVAGFFGYLTFGMVADRLGRRPAFTIYGLVAALGLVMITVFWRVLENSPPVLLFFMLLAGFGIGFFGGFGPLFAELFPTSVRNLAMGAAFNIARGVQFFTPVIIAMVAARADLGTGILIAAIFSVCVAGWIWVLPETKGVRIISTGPDTGGFE
jgi:MFS family permease